MFIGLREIKGERFARAQLVLFVHRAVLLAFLDRQERVADAGAYNCRCTFYIVRLNGMELRVLKQP